jgi:hypothetical protein
VKIQGAPDMFDLDICWGSLVPLGGNREGNAKKQQAGEKKKKRRIERRGKLIEKKFQNKSFIFYWVLF